MHFLSGDGTSFRPQRWWIWITVARSTAEEEEEDEEGEKEGGGGDPGTYSHQCWFLVFFHLSGPTWLLYAAIAVHWKY